MNWCSLLVEFPRDRGGLTRNKNRVNHFKEGQILRHKYLLEPVPHIFPRPQQTTSRVSCPYVTSQAIKQRYQSFARQLLSATAWWKS